MPWRRRGVGHGKCGRKDLANPVLMGWGNLRVPVHTDSKGFFHGINKALLSGQTLAEVLNAL